MTDEEKMVSPEGQPHFVAQYPNPLRSIRTMARHLKSLPDEGLDAKQMRQQLLSFGTLLEILADEVAEQTKKKHSAGVSQGIAQAAGVVVDEMGRVFGK